MRAAVAGWGVGRSALPLPPLRAGSQEFLLGCNPSRRGGPGLILLSAWPQACRVPQRLLQAPGKDSSGYLALHYRQLRAVLVKENLTMNGLLRYVCLNLKGIRGLSEDSGCCRPHVGLGAEKMGDLN